MERQRVERLIEVAAVASGVAAFVVVLAHALRLLAYPYDWSPDEGLAFEQARRLLDDPRSLYGRRIVPYPAVYGLGLPALLAPGLAVFPDIRLSLLVGRSIAIAWTICFACAVYLLVRRSAGRALAVAAASLTLLPLSLSFWHLIVRADGLMHACWVLAALPLLPRRLERGADRLGWRRIAAGCALLFAAALAKPTGVLHGAPLVLGWLLVDVVSFARLSLALAALGAAWVVGMQWATAGGYLWVTLVWSTHRFVPEQTSGILLYFLRQTFPVWLFTLAGIASRALRRGRPLSESAWLLLAGGFASVPILGKGGATAHYLLPLLTAVPVLGSRLFGAPEGSAARTRSLHEVTGGAVAAAAALTLMAFHPGTLPTSRDEATARAFYDFVVAASRDARRPLLAVTPDWAYFVAGQAAVTQGAAFPYLVDADLPGTDDVLRAVREGAYGVIVTVPDFWPPREAWQVALRERYALAGGCRLGYYYGDAYLYLLFVPAGQGPVLTAPPGTACARDYRQLGPGRLAD